MRIQTKLTLQFAIIVTSILFLFSALVFYSNAIRRENNFYSRLKSKATNTVRLLIDVKEVDSTLLKLIDKNKSKLNGEDVMIYDSVTNQKIYDSNDSINISLSKEELINVEKKDEVRFKKGDREIIATDYSAKNHNNYIVVASAIDTIGLKDLKKLRLILAVGLFVSVVITLLMGRIFVGRVVKLISKLRKQVQEITTSKLHHRLDIGKNKDELSKLAITLNEMLERLENGFNVQKMFVSNASHEFRTPIASSLFEIELALKKERTNEQYIETLNSIADDLKRLNSLSEQLLELSQASLDVSTFHFTKLRIDDLLQKSKKDLLNRMPGDKVNISFENLPDDDALITIKGNEQLLRTAFCNLMCNGCRYSDNNEVSVKLTSFKDILKIEFTDTGIGIPETEFENIFEPFFRGSNVMNKSGYGLGLALVKKIIELHGGKIQVVSAINKGSTFTVFLPV